jgi:hypothetical protein
LCVLPLADGRECCLIESFALRPEYASLSNRTGGGDAQLEEDHSFIFSGADTCPEVTAENKQIAIAAADMRKVVRGRCFTNSLDTHSVSLANSLDILRPII